MSFDARAAVRRDPVRLDIRRQVLARDRLRLRAIGAARRARSCSGGISAACGACAHAPDRRWRSRSARRQAAVRGLGARPGLAAGGLASSASDAAIERRDVVRVRWGGRCRRLERRLERLGELRGCSVSFCSWSAGMKVSSVMTPSTSGTSDSRSAVGGRRSSVGRQHVDRVRAALRDRCADRGRSRPIRPSGCAGSSD